MKVALAVTLILATAHTVPSPKKSLSFRNLYKDVLPGAKPKPQIDGRIMNGQIAEPHSIPYQVFLTLYSKTYGWYCGGSLVSEKYVLTAGHCGVKGVKADIILGAHALMKQEDEQILVTATNIVVHPQFNSDKLLNDIAVIGLPEPVELNNVVNTVPLPFQSDVNRTYEGVIARVSGWGLTDGLVSALSEYLRYVENPIIRNKECNAVFGDIENYQVCLSNVGGRGPCTGDQGGPLVVNGTIIGVASYGSQYCTNGYPYVFTRTDSFLDFIQQNTDVKIV